MERGDMDLLNYMLKDLSKMLWVTPKISKTLFIVWQKQQAGIAHAAMIKIIYLVKGTKAYLLDSLSSEEDIDLRLLSK